MKPISSSASPPPAVLRRAAPPHATARRTCLRQEHLAGAEEVAHDVHARHQRALDHRQRVREALAALLHVLRRKQGQERASEADRSTRGAWCLLIQGRDGGSRCSPACPSTGTPHPPPSQQQQQPPPHLVDEVRDALDERVGEAFAHGLAAPLQRSLGGARRGAARATRGAALLGGVQLRLLLLRASQQPLCVAPKKENNGVRRSGSRGRGGRTRDGAHALVLFL
jgi:hypothetical protein